LGGTLKSLSSRPDIGELLGYYPITGHPKHRAAGAKWIQRTGLSATPDHVIICNGVQHGLATIFGALSTPGDVVVTEELNYPGVRLLERLYHLRLKQVSIDEYGIRPQSLEAACARDAPKFLLCTPTIHNPTTSVMPLERRKAITEIAAKRNLTIVENGINGTLPREPALPLAAFAPERSYYVTSFSKTIGAGVRLGYILGPDSSLEKLAVAVQATTWLPSPLIGEIVSMWIEDGTAEKFLEWHRREAETRQQLAKTILGRCEYESHPNGYHIWLRIPEPWREQEFVAEASKRNVLLNPAEAFLIGRGAVPHAIRISLGGVKSQDVLSRGLSVIREILSRGPQPARVTI
jgi:DNA-binding transcriptional MocR family regulator